MGTSKKTATERRPSELRVVGRALRKVDATSKVTGATRFADDLFLPRMLYAKLLRSPHPHARIVSIDPSAARSLPGVKAVLTGPDLPIPFGILPVSQDEHALALDKVRFVGDPVAAVAATTEEIATQALDLIRVEYEPLRAFPNAIDAVEHADPAIHDYADAGNIHKLIDLEFGDVDAGFRDGELRELVIRLTGLDSGQARELIRAREGLLEPSPAPVPQRDRRLAENEVWSRRANEERVRAAHRVELDTDAALRASSAREGARALAGSDPRDRLPQRRGLRRQERPLQP